MVYRLLVAELRRYLAWPWLVIGTVIAAVPLLTGVSQAGSAVFRDELDLFGSMVTNPVVLIFPLLVTLLTGLGFSAELRARFILYTRTRMEVRDRLLLKLAAGVIVSFVVFFLYGFIAFLAAFYVLPSMGVATFDPSLYGLEGDALVQDSYGRAAFTSLLSAGTLVYGVVYSAWLGTCAAVFAAVGLLALLFVRNRVIALALPWVLYLGATIAAALAGRPNVGLLYTVFPFGLSPISLGLVVIPMMVLAALTAAGWVVALRKTRTADILA